ncbi:hypothetical protein ABTY59_37320 [Streptomyces sp. NPDC096079]|uniref:hypothetical protein n=1 Tax=Streptomyces sp. NPDC096079 TaxID=3155820 RepID=UPI0033338960
MFRGFSETLATAIGQPTPPPPPLTRRQALGVWLVLLWEDVLAPLLLLLLALAVSAALVIGFVAAARYGWEIAG